MADAPKPKVGGKKIAGLDRNKAIILFVVVAVGVFLYLRYRASHQAAASVSTASVPTTGTQSQPAASTDSTGGVTPDLSAIEDMLGTLQQQITGLPYSGAQAFGTNYDAATGSFQPTPGATSSTVPSDAGAVAGMGTQTLVPAAQQGTVNTPSYNTPVYSNKPAESLPGGKVSTGAAGAAGAEPSYSYGSVKTGGSFDINPVAMSQGPSYLPTNRILGKNVPLS